ncbi:MAG: hypothetical protein KGO53_06495 [Alphaproteobacteria bacterium]|nr:hypothetical protein [Alphaproteobacteria bacterium]
MMKKICILAVAAAMAMISTGDANAAGYCPSRPQGKCPKARVWKPFDRNKLTDAQRRELWNRLNIACGKEYGNSHLVEIDYYTGHYTCGY